MSLFSVGSTLPTILMDRSASSGYLSPVLSYDCSGFSGFLVVLVLSPQSRSLYTFSRHYFDDLVITRLSLSLNSHSLLFSCLFLTAIRFLLFVLVVGGSGSSCVFDGGSITNTPLLFSFYPLQSDRAPLTCSFTLLTCNDVSS